MRVVRARAILFSLLLILPQTASAGEAPSFSGKDLAGNLHSNGDYRGKHLVLYFWATWCPGCRQEAESMHAIYERYQSKKGVEFLSVSLDSDRTKLEKAVRSSDIQYPVLFDGKGWKNKIATRYRVFSTPTFVIIDPAGEEATRGSGSRDLDHLLQKI